MSENGRLIDEKMVRFERLLPGPIERVWEFLTSGERIGEWFGQPGLEYIFEPREGGTIRLADGHVRGVVTQWKPPRRLTYTWNVFSLEDLESRFPESYVAFELEPQGEEVRLILTHRPMLEGFEGQTMMGWHTILDVIGAMLRGEEQEDREMLYKRNGAIYGVKEIKR